MTASLKASLRHLVESLARHEPWERGHSERVAVYAAATAHGVGFRGDALTEIRIAAEAHDVGKILLYERGGALSGEDRRLHPALGEEMLPAFPPSVREAVRHHHERLDGSGYPDALHGPGLSWPAQVVGLAEWFDVARHGSPFAEGRPLADVREELEAHAGVWFEREVVLALLAVQRVIQPVGT